MTERAAIRSGSAPPPIGPYCQGIRAGGFIFLSGQIGLDPETGALVSGGAAEEARRALANLRAVLGVAGAGFADVVRTTVYLVDLADAQAVNEVYAEAFPAPAPARTLIGVASLPKGARIEIDAIAVARTGG